MRHLRGELQHSDSKFLRLPVAPTHRGGGQAIIPSWEENYNVPVLSRTGNAAECTKTYQSYLAQGTRLNAADWLSLSVGNSNVLRAAAFWHAAVVGPIRKKAK